MALEYAGQILLLQQGTPRDDTEPGWDLAFRRHLETESQPFELVAGRRVQWSELPWSLMLSWSLLVAVLLLGTRALLRQRADRQRAQEILRLGQVARLNTLGELAAGMAQELKHPLTEMAANARVANRVLDEVPPDLLTAQLAMRQAATHAQQASAVINRLRQAAGQPDRAAQTRNLDLHEVTRKALYLLESEFRRRSVEPVVELSGSACFVRAEPVALDQILHNLLMNALQALDQVQAKQRKLLIVLSATEKYGLLSLRDTGTGIPSGVLPHIFEPFFTTRESGLGLGLSLSESLARGMGGTLMAFNRTPRGAEFCLSLPLASPG